MPLQTDDRQALIDDLRALWPLPLLGRRGFARSAALGAGFALAVQPVAASTIATDSDGLDAGMVAIPAGDRDIPGYRARPAGVSDAPVVLVIHEVFGVHAYIQDVCRRFAKQGYCAIAPDCYVRQGDTKGAEDFAAIMGVVGKVPDAQVMADLDATVAWAGATGQGDASRLAITGFCWGGRVVWLYAAHNPALGAGVAWYGRLVGEANDLQPAHPVDLAARLAAPVLGLYGSADRGIPVDTIEKMTAALTAAGKADSTFVVYPEGNHGFHADYRDSYQQAFADDGWQRCLAWFRDNGVG